MVRDEIVQCPFVSNLIRRKACRMIRRCGYSRSDLEDLEQDLRVRVLEAWPRFDRVRGDERTFVAVVIELAAALILRGRFRQSKRDRLAKRIHRDRLASGESGDYGLFELRDDVRSVSMGLDEALRDLVNRLQLDQATQVARDLGVPRTTLLRWVDKLRTTFTAANLDKYE